MSIISYRCGHSFEFPDDYEFYLSRKDIMIECDDTYINVEQCNYCKSEVSPPLMILKSDVPEFKIHSILKDFFKEYKKLFNSQKRFQNEDHSDGKKLEVIRGFLKSRQNLADKILDLMIILEYYGVDKLNEEE